MKQESQKNVFFFADYQMYVVSFSRIEIDMRKIKQIHRCCWSAKLNFSRNIGFRRPKVPEFNLNMFVASNQ